MAALAPFLEQHRDSLTRRWMAKVRAALPSERRLDDAELLDSILFFLDEVIAGVKRGGPLPDGGRSVAGAHGAERQALDRDVTDVISEYGLLFESVVEECAAHGVPPFEPREYAVLVVALVTGAAEAARAYAALRDAQQRKQSWEHFAFLAHEIRNPLQTARLALTLARSAGVEKALPSVQRSLAQIAELLDRALVEARLRSIGSGAELHREETDLTTLLASAIEAVQPDADTRQIRIALACEKASMTVDRRLLRSALGNLLHNAVKFTRSHGTVTLRGRAGLIEVEDECGGLRPGDETKIFQTFQQVGEDRSGFGLGLAIAREAVEAHGGRISVRNRPGKGCVFSVELPETSG